MHASLLNHPTACSVRPGTLPAINVGRTPTSVEVYAFAPGLDASKIDVSLDRGVLRIAGERASSVPGNDPKVHEAQAQPQRIAVTAA